MTRRSLLREVGNPLSLFHGSGRSRNVKWSAFRVFIFGLWLAFLFHWPATWGPWDFAALAVLALAIPVADLFAIAPISEGLAALAAIFGATISKRMSTTTVATVTEITPAKPESGEGDI